MTRTYFFNPFGDYWLGADYLPEASADVADTRYADDIAAAEDLLRRVPAGTWILTYNGFGGRMPASYELVRVDWKLRGVLRLWRKRRDTARIGSPRTMKSRSRARLALASSPRPAVVRPHVSAASEHECAPPWRVIADCDRATRAVDRDMTIARLFQITSHLSLTSHLENARQRANVGRRFYRAPGTQAPGSGLGLSIVQRILDLHRGTIQLDSPATTIGLQVTIALPRVAG